MPQGSTEPDELIRARQEGREALSPWVGWFVAPMAWALHQGIGYAMVPWLCRIDTRWPYYLLTLVSLILCGVGILAAVHALRRSRWIKPEHSHQRMRMMALIGLMLSGAAMGGIAANFGPSFLVGICTGGGT